MKKTTVGVICSVLMVLVLVSMSIGPVSAKDNDESVEETVPAEPSSKIETLVQPIESEAQKLLANTESLSTEEFDALTNELIKKYARNLDVIMDIMGKAIGESLMDKQEKTLEQLIVRDLLGNILQEREHKTNREPDAILKPELVESEDNYKLFRTSSKQGENPYPVNWWVQLSVDIEGGVGSDGAGLRYWIDGNNDLGEVDLYVNSGDSVTYELWYLDEDFPPDPVMDEAYDLYRETVYTYKNGYHDKEELTIENDIIDFSGIWDNGKTYAYPIGQHGDKTRSYSSNVKIYVSNVWNHAMDIYDTNPNMDKTWWYTGW